MRKCRQLGKRGQQLLGHGLSAHRRACRLFLALQRVYREKAERDLDALAAHAAAVQVGQVVERDGQVVSRVGRCLPHATCVDDLLVTASGQDPSRRARISTFLAC
jgi:hypothetical protein